MHAADVRQIPWTRKPAIELLNAVWLRVATEAVAASAWMSRTLCGLGGHVMVRHFERDRISLECLSCGHRTAGWAVQPRRH